MRRIFPEAWRDFVGFLPAGERDDILNGYYRRLTDPDPDVHMPAARAWSAYEGACSTLMPSPETVAAFQRDRMALGLARIEAHYFVGKMFVAENQLLDNVRRINHLPCTIVQGRYDIVCPIMTADELAAAWPGADYVVVPDAGHSAMEPGTRKALVQATEKYKTLLSAPPARKRASG
jgi:proline iminopeptidase